MITFALWLITPDRELADKWYRLYSRERLNVRTLRDLSLFGRAHDETWGLAFVEIGQEGLCEPRDLKTFLNGAKNISVIVFGRPGKITNTQISGFLENGADDFITTDIDGNVLLSKTKAHIRRLLPNLNLARTVVTSGDGDLEIDKFKRTIRLGLNSGKEKNLDDLPPKEFEILAMLLGSENYVVSRKSLMEEIWQEKSGHVNFETIDKHVEVLRRRLGTYGKNIRTVYGTGYIYKSEVAK